MKLMDLNGIHAEVEEAVSAHVDGIQLPGSVNPTVGEVAVSLEQLQQLAAQLEQHGKGEITLSVCGFRKF